MEVWWRMHFHHTDLHHRVLGIRLRKLLTSSVMDFSVQALCSLGVCGFFCEETPNHRGTENTEVAQRRNGN